MISPIIQRRTNYFQMQNLVLRQMKRPIEREILHVNAKQTNKGSFLEKNPADQ